jgi:phage gp36-like protein
MTYAAQTDIDARYPGELAQAGPRDSNGDLDTAAIDLALSAADAIIDRALRVIGWTLPLSDPVDEWVITLAVDLALYLATPTVLASQADFADRKTRYQDALATLEAIARGDLLPQRPAGNGASTTLYTTSNDRLFGRGRL